MTRIQQTANGWGTAMRWGGRIVGLAAVGLFVLFLLTRGTKIFPSLSWASTQGIPLLISVVVGLAGGLVAWRWELAGGVMAVAGAGASVALVCAGAGSDMLLCGLFFALPLLLAGSLDLGWYWRTRTAAHAL